MLVRIRARGEMARVAIALRVVCPVVVLLDDEGSEIPAHEIKNEIPALRQRPVIRNRVHRHSLAAEGARQPRVLRRRMNGIRSGR